MLVHSGTERCLLCYHETRVVTAARLRARHAGDGVHLHLTLVGGQRYWHAVTALHGRAAEVCGDPERCVPLRAHPPQV